MKNKYVLLVVLICLFARNVYAGLDQEYGKKVTWWTQSYDELMGYLGIGKSYAVVIGVSQYDDKIFSYLPSEKDAVRIKNYLINEAGFDHVRLITGEKVTVTKVRKYMLDYYPKKLKKNDRFLFYWSGHGVTAGQSGRKSGYLALKTSSKNNPSTMISMANISQWDRSIKAKQTLYLLDSCFSGIAASRAMSIRREQTIERINQPSRQVLTAGLENQQTVAINDIDGGVFTRAVLDGLRGHADTNKGPFKKDGVVTIRELEEYVRERVDHERRRVRWKKLITPQLYNFSESAGDFFFVSDKRVIKSQALIQGGNTSAIPTGVYITQPHIQHPQPKIPNIKPIGGFIDHGNGTVTDMRTGLVWKKCSEGQNNFTCSGKANVYTWSTAKNYSNRVSFSGANNWRMPTINELKTLKVGGRRPAINTAVFPNTHNFSMSWSATTASVYDAWAFDFAYGNPVAISKDNRKQLRLVRNR